jgi:predicted membrane channel-forming protein YqfA (hemolysin III family)
MIISCVFLLITVSVYFLLWEKQNVHSWIIQTYTASLFMMYLFLVLLHFANDLGFRQTMNYDNGLTSCQAIGKKINLIVMFNR